jgi:hypothetical protein
VHPACSISFFARVFDARSGRILKENRTPWSEKNAVNMRKHDIIPFGATRTSVQFAADLRAHANGLITTFLIEDKRL